eukprot:11174394-Heterocapsa_arctica.AAC.1
MTAAINVCHKKSYRGHLHFCRKQQQGQHNSTLMWQGQNAARQKPYTIKAIMLDVAGTTLRKDAA